MNDIERVCAEGDLHAIEDIKKKLIRDDWAIPPGIELDCTVNGSNGDMSHGLHNIQMGMLT
jgi:hypothetical protein